jgi:hypothetical protein
MARRPSVVLFAILAAVSVATVAGADTKIVKQQHSDAYTVMGQSQPARDQTTTTWVAADRLRSDQGQTSFIVRLDTSTLLVVDHEAKTFSELKLPVDISSLMPPEMAAGMKKMMTFTATVTPTDETKVIGTWKTRRFDIKMSSPMVEMTSQVWVTKDVGFDIASFTRMGEQIMSMQPGMAGIAEELRKIDGFQVRQENVTTMTMGGNAEVRSSEEVVSVEDLPAPAGTYDPPAGYEKRSFDFQSMMRRED